MLGQLSAWSPIHLQNLMYDKKKKNIQQQEHYASAKQKTACSKKHHTDLSTAVNICFF